MTILGKKKIGLLSYSRTVNFGMGVGPFRANEDGTIDSISCYSLTGSGQFKMAVYEGTPGVEVSPSPRVAQSGAITVSGVGWQTAVATGNLVKDRFYWICVQADNTHSFAYNNTEGVWWRTTNNNDFNTGFPATWSSGAGTRLRGISIYLDYTPAVPAEDTSLQARINRAAPGSTIRVRSGHFNESIIINKPLRLIGTRDRKGQMPIIQSGELITGWTQSTKPEHIGKNVWYKDGINAVWIRSLQLNTKGVQVIQAEPVLSGAGVSKSEATALRDYLLTNPWDDTSGHTLFGLSSAVINFWQWYDALAALTPSGLVDGDPAGRLYLRLKNDLDPNDMECYLARSQHETDYYESDYKFTPVTISNQANVTISNFEIRGGSNAITIENSSDVKIEKCRIKTAGLRGIFVSDSENTTIKANEITADWMQSNCVPGIGGSTDKAKAGWYCWNLSKHYSIMNTLAPHGHCIAIAGTSTGFLISKNWFHQNGGGVGWAENINDKSIVYGTIENNLFENMYSNCIVYHPGAHGLTRYNLFRECNIFFRIQDMGDATQPVSLVQIDNNTIWNDENAGNLLQAHNNPGPTTWTIPVVFTDNFIYTIDPFIANQLTVVANITATGNVFDHDSPFEANTINYGMTSFNNNWVGGNVGIANTKPWWGAGNQYIPGQRLPLEALPPVPVLPPGFEQVGPYQQKTGLPVIRGSKTYGAWFNG